MGYGRSTWTFGALVPLLLLTVLLLAAQLAQPPAPESLKPKVFVLGLSKTGTTSIGDALERLGYRRLGWRDIRSRHMVHTWASGQRGPLIELTRYYDAFEDLPWPFMYREMAEMYPDAKFILSIRKDEQTWLRSMRVHVGRGKWLPYSYFYGADTFEGNEQIMAQSYRNHTKSARDYFEDKPDRFIEINIDNGDVNWDVLCRAAQCPGGKVPAVDFPQSNTAASWEAGAIVNKLRWLKGWTVTRVEEQTSHYYYYSGRSFFKPLLSFLWSIYDLAERIWTELGFKLMLVILPPLQASPGPPAMPA